MSEPFLFAQADELEHVVDGLLALGRADAVTRGEKVEVLRDFHVFVHAEEIRHVAKDAPNLIRLADDVVAKDARGAGRGREKSREDAQRCSFAGAVRADEAKQVAAVYGEVELVQCGEGSVVPREAEGFDGGIGDRRRKGG